MNAPADDHLKQLLKANGLRNTGPREEILALFLSHSYALAHGDIEAGISSNIDRVTVYRTLRTFLEKGILHKVLDDGGSVKYALCQHACNAQRHAHEHVHFKCVQCGQTVCIEDVDIPAISLPGGYRVQEMNLLVQGTCQHCQPA